MYCFNLTFLHMSILVAKKQSYTWLCYCASHIGLVYVHSKLHMERKIEDNEFEDVTI